MEFMNCLLPFVEIAVWVIIIVAICNYDPKREECVLMKDERGEDVTIYTVKMQFDRHHNYVHELSFRCGDPDEDKAVQGCLDECANIAFKLGICATMKITLTDDDTGEQKVFWKIRKDSEHKDLVDASSERIWNANV